MHCLVDTLFLHRVAAMLEIWMLTSLLLRPNRRLKTSYWVMTFHVMLVWMRSCCFSFQVSGKHLVSAMWRGIKTVEHHLLHDIGKLFDFGADENTLFRSIITSSILKAHNHAAETSTRVLADEGLSALIMAVPAGSYFTVFLRHNYKSNY